MEEWRRTEVFISYASPDLATAKRLEEILTERNIRCWLAPSEIAGGDDWRAEIERGMGRSAAVVLVWSEHAAASKYVKQEVGLAESSDLVTIPLRLDETDYPAGFGLALGRVNHITITPELGDVELVERIENSVRKQLALRGVAPHPLGRLFQELRREQKPAPDISACLEGLRLLMRFVALLHTARYLHSRRYTDDLNRAVERLFSSESLFVDLDVAHKLMEQLEANGTGLHPGFHQFFQAANYRAALAAFFDHSQDDAQKFDRDNLHALLGTERVFAEHSQLPPAEATNRLCDAIQKFSAEVLAQRWLEVCKLSISFLQEGGSEVTLPVIEAQDLARLKELQVAGARLSLLTPAGSLVLSPFFQLMRTPSGEWEIGLLRGQQRHARFTPLTTQPGATAELPLIVLPWGTLEVTRALPRQVFDGELYTVRLSLVNHGREELEVLEVCEQLPDNLLTADGKRLASVAESFGLKPGESRTVEYWIRGHGQGLDRVYPRNQTVAYRHRGEPQTTPIRGDEAVKVRTLPAPGVEIVRHFCGPDGAELTDGRLLLDSRITVETVVRSVGAATPELQINDVITGARVLEGSVCLCQGMLARADLQTPVAVRYQLLVTGSERLLIRPQMAAAGAEVGLHGGEKAFEIQQLPPPALELRWRDVKRCAEQASGYEMDAELLITNNGGTTAYDVTMTHTAKDGVQVSARNGSLTRRDLAVKQELSLPFRISSAGLPTGEAHFTATCMSVRDERIESSLKLRLDRLMDWNAELVFSVGRETEVTRLANWIEQPKASLMCVQGEVGVGKIRLVTAAVDALRRRSGLRVGFHQLDCEETRGFVHAAATLFESVAVGLAASADEFPLATALGRIGLGSKHLDTKILTELVHEQKRTSGGTWRSVALALEKFAKEQEVDRLVLALWNLSRFSRKELEDLMELQRELARRAEGVRLIVTSDQPPEALGLETQEISLDRFTMAECRELIGRVFILPPAHESLQLELIKKSERIPSDLNQLLRQLYVARESVLDFSHPLGVQIRDRRAFDELPTTFIESERKAAKRAAGAEVPRALLACLACQDSAVATSTLLTLLQQIGESATEGQLEEWLGTCRQKYHWLTPSGTQLTLRSAAVRTALREVASPERCQAVHQAICLLDEQDKLPCKDRLAHLVASPAGFVRERGNEVVAVLRERVARGSFSEVQAALKKLQVAGVQFPAEQALDLAVLEQELKWEETGVLKEETLEALRRQVIQHGGRGARALLRTRLELLASRFYKRCADYRKAVAVAEAAEWRLGPLRWLPLRDRGLKFDFYLNLWAVCYEALDAKRFVRVDRWIWNHLRRARKSPRAAHEIASFLSLFLAFQRRFSDPLERERHFPAPRAVINGREILVDYNPIEQRTRAERLRESFINQALAHPDQLNLANAVELARLYFHIGCMEWTAKTLMQRLNEEPKTPKPFLLRADEQTLTPYLKLAEERFGTLELPYDRAAAQRKIGETYLDRVRFLERDLARSVNGSALTAELVTNRWVTPFASEDDQKIAEQMAQFQEEQRRQLAAAHPVVPTADEQEVAEVLLLLCQKGAGWLERAASGFDSIEAVVDAGETWELHAELLRRWAEHDLQELVPAITAQERLCAHPALRAQPQRLSACRLTLIQLYERAGGRAKAAAELLDQMEATSEGVAKLKALIHAEILLEETDPSAAGTLEDYEKDFELLIHERASAARDAAVNQPAAAEIVLLAGERLARAIGLLALHLAECHRQHEDGERALCFLREARSELTQPISALAPFRQRLPELLSILWHMASTADDARTQDFANLVLPLATEANWATIERMLQELWTREMKREHGKRSFAAVEMGIILCENTLERKELSPTAALIQELQGWLVALTAADLERRPELLARALMLLLRVREASQDDELFWANLDRFRTTLSEAGTMDAVLRLLVHLVQFLMDMHMRTRKDWYNGIIPRVSDLLPETQRQSSNQFDDIALLIQLYVQLPNRTLDAVELIEQQCQRLLDQGNYELLARYLSFLSDLLGSALLRDEQLAGLDRLFQLLRQVKDPAAAVNEATAAISTEPMLETQRTRTLQATALKLCGHVIARLRGENIGRTGAISVLYNVAKLLKEEDTGDLRCAIYTKLYELSAGSDGPSVWGVFQSFSVGTLQERGQFLDDCIALTSYSNTNAEDVNGDILSDSPRNYLITVKQRNALIEELRAAKPTEHLLAVRMHLELTRMQYIEWLIGKLHEIVSGRDELGKLEFVTFLHGYLFEVRENFPLWQMIQRIEGFRLRLREQMNQALQEAARNLASGASGGSLEALMRSAPPKVEQFLVASRRRGREIMAELVERIRGFNIGDILGDVQRFVEGKSRLIDFKAALGIWGSDEEAVAARRGEREHNLAQTMLKMDPETMLPLLLANGLKLLRENEASLGERFYRRALELTDTMQGGSGEFRAEAFHGLMRALRQQGRLEEARNVGERALAIYAEQKGPRENWSAVESDLGELLLSFGDPQEATAHFCKAVWIAKSDQQHLIALRQTASRMVSEGRCLGAGAILEQLLEIGFEVPATHAHLARVCLLTDRADEARKHAEQGWIHRSETKRHSVLRLLWFRLVFAFLDFTAWQDSVQGELISRLLGQLKTGLQTSDAYMEWTMDAVLNKLSSGSLGKLDPADFDLLVAIVAALSEAKNVPALNAIPAWRETKAEPLE